VKWAKMVGRSIPPMLEMFLKETNPKKWKEF
jgi:hypothetical protein